MGECNLQICELHEYTKIMKMSRRKDLSATSYYVSTIRYKKKKYMETEKATVKPLHHDWKYLEACCDLINEEWPRSVTARMHNLKGSCDNFPTSLILIHQETGNEDATIVGHSKVSSIHRVPSACFVESVVVAKKHRGKGWGRYIMSETESYVRSKGKKELYLSTSDKEEFYRKLGYVKCEPVSLYGGSGFIIKNNYFSSLLNLKSALNSSSNVSEKLSVAPPQPPPLPPKSISNSPSAKVYMRKILSFQSS